MSVAVLSDISTGQPTIDSTSVLLLVIETSCWSVPSVDNPQIHDPRNEETSNDTRNFNEDYIYTLLDDGEECFGDIHFEVTVVGVVLLAVGRVILEVRS
jgi:hypothetical protein